MNTHLVEINLISAQGLKIPQGNRRVQTYAVVWIDPAAKLRSAVDHAGGENPTWNEKFVFRVPAALLSPDSPSALSVEIYASCGWCLPNSLVGSARLLLANLHLLDLPMDAPAFSAVGVRRISGRIQGILNVGAAVLTRIPVFITKALAGSPAVGYRDFIQDGARPQFRRPTPVAKYSPLKECNRDVNGGEDDCGVGGRKALCWMSFPRKIHSSPSDQNLANWEIQEKGHR
ncbi:BON1-associated protein 2 [Platanthera guangdongensis]|uniref:BON1-associated protein 2 n=1 Tax=Platanthera guangdongensis TaxID=2320717 RepID=A0ABR2N566_9ASPA